MDDVFGCVWERFSVFPVQYISTVSSSSARWSLAPRRARYGRGGRRTNACPPQITPSTPRTHWPLCGECENQRWPPGEAANGCRRKGREGGSTAASAVRLSQSHPKTFARARPPALRPSSRRWTVGPMMGARNSKCSWGWGFNQSTRGRATSIHLRWKTGGSQRGGHHQPARPPFVPRLAALSRAMICSRSTLLLLLRCAGQWPVGPMRARSKRSSNQKAQEEKASPASRKAKRRGGKEKRKSNPSRSSVVSSQNSHTGNFESFRVASSRSKPLSPNQRSGVVPSPSPGSQTLRCAWCPEVRQSTQLVDRCPPRPNWQPAGHSKPQKVSDERETGGRRERRCFARIITLGVTTRSANSNV